MRRFSSIHPLWMSFYAKDIYRDVARFWSTGKCFLYLLALIAICSIPVIVKVNAVIGSWIDNEAPRYVNQMPAITITKGTASISEPQPYTIKDPDTGEPFMLIDTTGGTKSLEGTKAHVLLTADRVLLRDEQQTYPSFGLAKTEDAVIDQTSMYEFLEGVKDAAALVIYPLAVALAYLYRVIQVLLMALIGIGMARVMGFRLRYAMLLRIVILAMTPLLIINALFFFFSIPDYWFLNLALVFGYLFFAIRSAAEAPITTA